MGATEKRRESGAGVAVVTDMGDLESVRLGGGGVYQDWDCGAWASRTVVSQEMDALLKEAQKFQKFPATRVPIALIASLAIIQITSAVAAKSATRVWKPSQDLGAQGAT